MALFIEVRNVSGSARVVDADGQRLEIPDNGTFKVSADKAGTAPRWRRAENGEDTTHLHTRDHAGHLEVFDLGSGFLAQPTNWRDAKAGKDHEDADPLALGRPVAADDAPKENS